MPELLYVLGAVTALAVLTVLFILSLRGTLTVGYDGEFFLFFKVLFFNVRLLPPKEEKRKCRRSMSRRRAKRIRRLVAQREERKQALKEKLFGRRTDKEKKTDEISDGEVEKDKSSSKPPVRLIAREVIDILSAFTEIIAILVKRFTHHLRIKVSKFKIKIATPDASVTAVTYGAATGILNVLLPILRDVDNLGLPKEESFDISADFVSDTPDIDIKVSFSLRTWHIADIALRSMLGGLSRYVKRKGGIDKTIDHISEIVQAFSTKKENKN